MLACTVYQPPKPVFKRSVTSDGWCVSFVRQNGFEKYTGDADRWLTYVNSQIPEVGSVIVLDEGPIGHLALVEEVTIDTIKVIEQNYLGRWIVSERTLDRSYKNILGYVTLD